MPTPALGVEAGVDDKAAPSALRTSMGDYHIMVIEAARREPNYVPWVDVQGALYSALKIDDLFVVGDVDADGVTDIGFGTTAGTAAWVSGATGLATDAGL